MRRILLPLVISLMAAVSAVAESKVDNLKISVLLHEDGTATISERWSIDVDSNISEWYLVLGNLGKMSLGRLSVVDETGVEYVNEGEWDVDRGRSAKAGRCGVVTKPNGYELCWGVGSSGPHTYTATYSLSGLVQGHEDLDGFNHMFVASGLGSSPERIELRISKPGTFFSKSNSQIWAFGYEGGIEFEDGEIVARTSSRFTKQSRMIVLAGFEKEIFEPSVTDGGKTFAQVRERALEKSDYDDSEGGDFWYSLLSILAIAAMAAIPFGASIRDSKRKKELLGGSEKDVAWFRETPVGGQLREAYTIITLMNPSKKDQENVIAAYFTRLLYRKALTITRDTDGKPRIKVLPYPEQERFVNQDLGDGLSDEKMESVRKTGRDNVSEQGLHTFLRLAAGEDGIVQEKELGKWLKKNDYTVYCWLTALKDKESTLKTLEAKDVREVYGLKRFLKDFTLIEDRGAVEIGLWNDYLVFASLFGIADQLRRDFKQVCPEYFELSKVEASLADPATAMVWSDIYRMSRSINSASDRYVSRTSTTRSSGGGGRASFGGGGGFSGGGHGGGGR